MAMLTSGEYTLIKKKTVHETKSMLFVKLTDSALRALDNYLKNIGKCESPIIEFNNDEGRILIPTCQKDISERDKIAQFKFNVISNEIMQGRQGRLECIQHKKGNRQLVKLGQLTHRLRVHANEDVYETTKNRMAAIEQEQRKNCTVLLDRNSPQMNRRNRLDRLSKPNPSPSLANKPTPLSATLPPQSTTTPTNEDTKVATVPETNMVRNKGRPITSTLPSKLSASCIIRKPLKDRIIHLLALRPYKKLELISALEKDGIRKCDKPCLSDTLTSVATLRDNTYHLSKNAWNDVQEDWYFYSDLERQQIKRSKSRNLTSPYSSDSGISVSSNLSPNPMVAAPSIIDKSPSSVYKRPGYFNGVDGFQTKRQRISHFVKPDPTPITTKSSPIEENAHTRTNNTCFDELNAAKSAPDRPHKPYNKYSPDSPDLAEPGRVPDRAQKYNKYSPHSPDPSEITRSCSDRGLKFNKYSPDSPDFSEIAKSGPKRVHKPNKYSADSPDPLEIAKSAPDRVQKPQLHKNSQNTEQSKQIPSVVITSPPVAASDRNGDSSRPVPDLKPSFYSPPNPAPDNIKHQKPKYMKDYVTITSMEQRRRYKSDFNSIFKEYQRVHEEIDSISNTFAQLGESLRQHEKNTPKYLKIEQEILKKYNQIKFSKNFQDAKKRFEYLHEKLSHIKNLVHEYDEKFLK